LIDAGTSFTTAGSDVAAAELEAADVVGLAAAELVLEGDELLLLLPHPAIATTPSSETTTESQLFRERIALPFSYLH
jgi:hypothetical protein